MKLSHIVACGLAGMVLACACAVQAAPVAKLTVSAGKADRVDTMACAVLEGVGELPKSVRLEKLSANGAAGRKATPCQLEPGQPAKLWFILNGKTPAGSQRTFELVEGEPATSEQGVEIKKDAANLDVLCGGKKVLQYHHAPVAPPPGADKSYTRSAYIHPLWSPSGMVMTEDSPKDHLHHKGIWNPWTHTRFEGVDVDFWNLKALQGTVRFVEFVSTTSGPVFGGFAARQDHVVLSGAFKPKPPPAKKAPAKGDAKKAGPAKPAATPAPEPAAAPVEPSGGFKEKVALKEVWDVRVYNVGGSGKDLWLFDIVSTQTCASSSPLVQLRYHYGGMGFRGARQWKGEDASVLTSEGVSRGKTNATRVRWCDSAGAIDGKWSGLVMMSHPSNFRHPEPIRTWDDAKQNLFCCFAPEQLGDFTMEPGQTYVFRYRFYAHEGKLDVAAANRLWQDFADPPSVKVEK